MRMPTVKFMRNEKNLFKSGICIYLHKWELFIILQLSDLMVLTAFPAFFCALLFFFEARPFWFSAGIFFGLNLASGILLYRRALQKMMLVCSLEGKLRADLSGHMHYSACKPIRVLMVLLPGLLAAYFLGFALSAEGFAWAAAAFAVLAGLGLAVQQCLFWSLEKWSLAVIKFARRAVEDMEKGKAGKPEEPDVTEDKSA